ncbi:hypothetical protein [Pantoea agglomerans]|uniref:hypothetical protein n=1 Tax=Enterobacter agglomerans TaxID=549 RepID=UPI002B1DA987|nr:hypothetical protein [Pantoea agglomerans]
MGAISNPCTQNDPLTGAILKVKAVISGNASYPVYLTLEQRAYQIADSNWVSVNYINVSRLNVHANFPVGSAESTTEITVYCNDKSEHVLGRITNTTTVTTKMDVNTTCQLTPTEGCTVGMIPTDGLVSLSTTGYDSQGKGTLTGTAGTFKYLVKGDGTKISLSGGKGLPKSGTTLTIEPDTSEGTPTGGVYTGQLTVTIAVL